MFLKTLHKWAPDQILVTDVVDSYLRIEKNTHFVFSYQGTNYITVELINGNSKMTYDWEPYNEADINNVFFSGRVEYIECSLEKYERLKPFF